MSEQRDKPISHHYEEACRQRSKPPQQQVASPHPVIKECGTIVNTLLLAQILAESRGSLQIHEPDWTDFLTLKNMRAAVSVCPTKLTDTIWKDGQKEKRSEGELVSEQLMKECPSEFLLFCFFFSAVPLLAVILDLPLSSPAVIKASSSSSGYLRKLCMPFWFLWSFAASADVNTNTPLSLL